MKPGQILRLGQVEMRLETDMPAGPAKKQMDQTLVMQRGVSLDELEQGHARRRVRHQERELLEEDRQGELDFLDGGQWSHPDSTLR